MEPRDAFDATIRTIGETSPLLCEGDASDLILAAVERLYDIDPFSVEQSLLEAAQGSGPTARWNYICGLMHWGKIMENLSGDTFDYLLGLCTSTDCDTRTREAAICALAWSEFVNSSPGDIERIRVCLAALLSTGRPSLSHFTAQTARLALDSIEQRTKAGQDLASGKIVIPEVALRELLARGEAGVSVLPGFGPVDEDSLVRGMAWMAESWLWPHLRVRRTLRCDVYENALPLVPPGGQPRMTLSLIWRLDRRSGVKTLLACYVGELGSRPDLLRMALERS